RDPGLETIRHGEIDVQERLFVDRGILRQSVLDGRGQACLLKSTLDAHQPVSKVAFSKRDDVHLTNVFHLWQVDNFSLGTLVSVSPSTPHQQCQQEKYHDPERCHKHHK